MHECTQVLTERQLSVHKMNNHALVVGMYKISPCIKKLNFGLYQDIYEIIFFSFSYISGNMLITRRHFYRCWDKKKVKHPVKEEHIQ